MSSNELNELGQIRRILANIRDDIEDVRNQINNSTSAITSKLDNVVASIGKLEYKIDESTNKITGTINEGIITTISESIIKEYANAYSKVITSRLQLDVLKERLKEVNQRYYSNYKNIIIDYLRNIRDFLNQFLNMSEQEFNILRRLLKLAKAADDIHNEVKPDWINKELIEAVFDSNIKKRLEDLDDFARRLRVIHDKLVEVENSINDAENLLKGMQLPIDIDDDVIIRVPITVVEVEVNGNSRSYVLKPNELNSEVLDSLVERASEVKDNYSWKINESDITSILRRLQSIAKGDDEYELLNKIKVIQVN